MRLTLTPLLLLPLIALGGCSNSSSQNRAIAPAAPPMFVEQVAVMVDQGQPKEQLAYRKDLSRCQADGTPTLPLSADDEARLGRRLTQTWQIPGQFAQRTQEWHQNLSGLCQFGVLRQDRMVLRTADNRLYTLDTASGKGRMVQGNPLGRLVAQTDDDLALTSSAQDAGWHTPTRQPPLLGHTCLLWENPRGDQVCVWDEGMPYGYSGSAQGLFGGDGTPIPQGPLMLWAKPAQGNGWEVRVTRFIIGQPIPPSVFQVPANAQANI